MDKGSHTTLVSQSSVAALDEHSSFHGPTDLMSFQVKNEEYDSTKYVPQNELGLSGLESHESSENSIALNYLQSPTRGTAKETLSAIQMLGECSFSKSFVEKIIRDAEMENSQVPFGGPNYLMFPYGSYAPPPVSYPSMEWFQNSSPSQWDGQISQSFNSSLTVQNTDNSSSTKQGIKRIRPDSMISRRKTVQHMMICEGCGIELGFAFLRGTYTCETEHPVRLHCQNCIASSNCQELDLQMKSNDRKRKRKDSKSIDCEVCRCKIGTGNLFLSSEEEVKSEFVCTDCGNKYMFCSECGGGGKQRTGKWRPRELFEQGRRTCSLPHIRVGAAELHYKVIPVEEITADILLGIQDVFFDCMLSLYCVPNVMATYKYGTFDVIKRDIERLWLKSVLDVLTNKVLSGRKYITVAWIHKRHRNKGMGRSNSMKDSVPWLHKLGLSGIVNPPPLAAGQDSEEKHHCFVAFSISEWDQISQSIFLAQMAPRSVFLKTMEGYTELIRNSVEYIKKEAEAEQIPKPTLIWCWAKADHARLQSIPTRLKFSTIEEYLTHQPSIDPAIFERMDYEPLNLECIQKFVTTIKTFSPKTQSKS
jgi:hypothetical protein